MIDRVPLTLIVLIAALVAAEWMFAGPHVVPGFHAVLAFVACVLVVLASKALGRLLLQRPEDADDS